MFKNFESFSGLDYKPSVLPYFLREIGKTSSHCKTENENSLFSKVSGGEGKGDWRGFHCLQQLLKTLDATFRKKQHLQKRTKIQDRKTSVPIYGDNELTMKTPLEPIPLQNLLQVQGCQLILSCHLIHALNFPSQKYSSYISPTLCGLS